MAGSSSHETRDRILDQYGFEGDARDQAITDLNEFAEVMLRIASRVARETTATDSPE